MIAFLEIRSEHIQGLQLNIFKEGVSKPLIE